MQIKKFIAPTLQEAMSQMKRELGTEAIILHSRNVPAGGLSDISGKQMAEVLAAVEEEDPRGRTVATRLRSRKTTGKAVASLVPPIPETSAPVLTPNSVASNAPPVISPELRRPPVPTDIRPVDMEALKLELRELRGTVALLADHLRYTNMPSLPENLQLVLKQLLDNEVADTLAKQIVQEAHLQLKGADYRDLKKVLRVVLDRIRVRLLTTHDKSANTKPGRVVGLIGPTGVGKTTTLAKLASIDKLQHGLKVALISADTFRIAATHQLRTFANIAEVPFEVVYSPEDMQAAVEKCADADRIYIDTTGRSQKDTEHLKDIGAMLTAAGADEVHLVLSATTKNRDVQDILKNFQSLMFNRLLFTKLDETTNLGLVLNVVNATRKPVSWLTTGQHVPTDIEAAQQEKLARMIIRRKFL